MRDGARLAGRLWLPDGDPAPGILEYIPYRKRDLTRLRDAQIHPFLASRGYACLRVDLRGSGDSDGVLKDEYLAQELSDGVDILEWMAAQPWCTGRVGMMGISWGGFNALQIAALRPKPLKAILTLCSTDDRYADDIHHMGGCLLGDNLSWASVMFSYNSLPPDPEIVGERWRDMWFARLEGSGVWLHEWLRHTRRDGYWKHGSVCEDYLDIQVPVYAVSGWADGYSNAVFRLLENLSAPRKGLVGPWGHKYPHLGLPGPAIGFLREATRWWDYWLKGIETGIMHEPMLRVWMQESIPPSAQHSVRPGRWVSESSWPSPRVGSRTFRFSNRKLVDTEQAAPETTLPIQSPLTVGLFAGKWCSYAAGPDLAHDQRQEDGGALLFDSEPLDAQIEVMGAPCLELLLRSNKPVAMVAVRLSDIAPDDKATRVSYGLLNLTHRDSSEAPTPLEPGRQYRVLVRLNHIAQVFPRNHRLRVALSTSYWPLAWPPPEPTRLEIQTSGCRFRLPLRPTGLTEDQPMPFDSPEVSPVEAHTRLAPGHHNWLVHRDLATDVSTLEVINDQGLFRLHDPDVVVGNQALEWYRSRADDFLSVAGETRLTRSLSRNGWSIRTVAHTILESDARTFRIAADLDAYEDDYRVFCRSWKLNVERDLV